ncbi:HAD-IIA family hydrolase [Actinomyces sp. B33]|uniref:HAD-IIA family hydrolase n=1 Tax=Actinomyces sp. B33 TaxID=2942131 RepID=UPI00233FD128|nr:HAD-IIA family hydrolase [Actinomyces sp. B33]MDC4233398.1 HAD-IIA family hydrolase [Actinomyces sp. B33]
MTMAGDQRGRFDEGRGGYQRRQNTWRDSSERSDSRRSDRSGRRAFDRDDRGSRSYGDRSERRGYDRDGDRRRPFESGGDRPGRRFSDDADGRRSFQSGGERRGSFGRDDRRGAGQGRRDDRASGRSDRRAYDRDDRGSRSYGDRSGRRDYDRGGQREFEQQNFASTDEYISPRGDEPTIPAGVSAEELDPAATRALTTLSGPNRDIVARHLVMAGQLIDLDPEQAYQHAMAASSRAGRVDVVREAAALTAYASGRYEEALREVRAVRRMRGDDSLRAVEADCERGLGRPAKAIEIIDQTDTKGMDLAEQVELVLVSSGARADLGESEVGLVLVDDAIAALPEDVEPDYLRRLMSVKADRLRELDRLDEADEVEAAMPDEIDVPVIVDTALFADADVDRKTSPLKGSDTPLAQAYDCALLDLDGTAWAGDRGIDHACESVLAAREAGMTTVFVTNNAMRTPQMVADKLTDYGFAATADMVMTSAMDVVSILSEKIDEGAKVFVLGGEGVRQALIEGGYQIVDSADDEPAAVVQGLDTSVDWAMLTEGALAIQRGARFFATNLDATLPIERGNALGNGSLVRAIEHATGVRPYAAGKPEPGIYQRGAALVEAQNPIAVGDRLETDILGAIRAGIPAMHVLTGVHGAREVILAPRGQRPSYLALDMRGLLEDHPRPKHHRDDTWTCGVSQVAKVLRNGVLTLDDIELTGPTTITLDSYRALAAAAWDWADSSDGIRCPELVVVDNDDETGIVVEPEPADDDQDLSEEQAPVLVDGDAPDSDGSFTDADSRIGVEADALPEPDGDAPTFLPGEEELEKLLAETADPDDDETPVENEAE